MLLSGSGGWALPVSLAGSPGSPGSTGPGSRSRVSLTSLLASEPLTLFTPTRQSSVQPHPWPCSLHTLSVTPASHICGCQTSRTIPGPLIVISTLPLVRLARLVMGWLQCEAVVTGAGQCRPVTGVCWLLSHSLLAGDLALWSQVSVTPTNRGWAVNSKNKFNRQWKLYCNKSCLECDDNASMFVLSINLYWGRLQTSNKAIVIFSVHPWETWGVRRKGGRPIMHALNALNCIDLP